MMTETLAGPTIEIETPRASFLEGEAVVLRVVIRNAAGPEWLLLIPRLGPEASGAWPELGLRLRVRDERGQEAPLDPEGPIVKRKPPLPCDFVEFHVGDFFGREINLSNGAFRVRFPGKGRYMVTASVISGAKRWLEEEIGSGRAAEGLRTLQKDRLFEGVAESNEVMIELR
jgi:hypothetical protein